MLKPLIDVVSIVVRRIKEYVFIAGLETVVRRVILEKAIVVRALTILQALEMNLARLLLFRLVDFPPRFGNIRADFEIVYDIELQSPDNVRRVLDVARLFKAFEGNGLRVICPIETAYHDKSRVRVSLKFLQLANGFINAQLCRLAPCRHDLQVVQTNDGSFRLVGAHRLEQFQ